MTAKRFAVRIKVLIPEREDFGRIVREITQVAPIHLRSERRRFVATEDLPEKTRAELIMRGVTIVPDERYDGGGRASAVESE